MRRGILSFVLVMLLAESLLYIYTSQQESGLALDLLEEDAVALQKFYLGKMQIKREVQNIIAGERVSPVENPYDAVERVARSLEVFERDVESRDGYNVDVWCGYVNGFYLDALLEAHRHSIPLKPPLVFDMSDKVSVMTKLGRKEVHACSTVLIFNHNRGMIDVGRGYSEFPDVDADPLVLRPVLGISISDPANGIYDVDYIDAIR